MITAVETLEYQRIVKWVEFIEEFVYYEAKKFVYMYRVTLDLFISYLCLNGKNIVKSQNRKKIMKMCLHSS